MESPNEAQVFDFQQISFSGSIVPQKDCILPRSAPDQIHYMGRTYYSDEHNREAGDFNVLFLENTKGNIYTSESQLIGAPSLTEQPTIIAPVMPQTYEQKKRGRPRKDRSYFICTECGARRTPEWRKGANGTLLCNACGLQFKKSLGIRDNSVNSILNPDSNGRDAPNSSGAKV